jgi:glucosylceramidase
MGLCFSLFMLMVGCATSKNPTPSSNSGRSGKSVTTGTNTKPDDTTNSETTTGEDSTTGTSVTDSKSKTSKKTSATTTNKKTTVKKYTVNGIPRAYQTTANSDIKFRRQSDNSVKVYNISKLDRKTGVIMEIDPNITYQTIEGFGASLTDTSCFNISSMPESMRNDLMTKLFDPVKGIGLTILRQPIGMSDFNVEYYTYDDMPEGEEDWELKHFSIERDKNYIIPLIKQAMNLNKDLKVIAACWTPPIWMKTKYQWNSFNKVSLRTECYEVFSQYLVKYLQAYAAEGIPIYAISPQNEPTGVHGIPACYYTAEDMGRLVNYYLAPAIKSAGLDSKLISWDFNWFEDTALSFIAAMYENTDIIAFHFYSGESSVMGNISSLFPGYPIWVTEAAGQYQAQELQLFRQMKYMSEGFRNNVSAWILWNITLDDNYGPTDPVGGKTNGIGLTQYKKTENKLLYEMDFYALAHYSKFIRPGAKIIKSTDLSVQSRELYYNTAAINENGTITVVIGNQSNRTETFKIVMGNHVVEYSLPPVSVVTLTWDANNYE